ncbi:hypothetical protein [Agrobacterium cavarae]|nr:hypothetical protein [Agrobacterium cavarae]
MAALYARGNESPPHKSRRPRAESENPKLSAIFSGDLAAQPVVQD